MLTLSANNVGGWLIGVVLGHDLLRELPEGNKLNHPPHTMARYYGGGGGGSHPEMGPSQRNNKSNHTNNNLYNHMCHAQAQSGFGSGAF